jgi:hypothetical protein
MWGDITGNIVLTPTVQKNMETGIDCFVKQVFIKKEYFGFGHEKFMSRVYGEVNADFIPVISARSDFIVDSPEYKIFYQYMKDVLRKIKDDIEALLSKKDQKRTARALTEVLSVVRKAIRKNPDLFPKDFGREDDKKTEDNDNSASELDEGLFAPTLQKELRGEGVSAEEKKEEEKKQERRKKAQALNRKKRAYNIKRLKIGGETITFLTDRYGKDAPPCFIENNLVCINMDYPMYLRQEKAGNDALAVYIVRLIAQSLALIRPGISPEQGFDIQNEIIKTAFC